MHAGRRIGILLAMAVGLAGCRAGGTGSLTLIPRRTPSAPAFDLERFVAEHNRNAETIESLEARPTVQVASRVASRVFGARVNGKMAFERPRNFKLVVDAEGAPQADLGSNDEEFWYWLKNNDKDQKWVYWCPYRDLVSSDLPVTYQPDWIIEAMGLRPITSEEASLIQLKRGRESGTTLLVFPPVRDRGEPFVRELTVSNVDFRVRKLQIYTERPRDLIAEATPSDYQTFDAAATGTAGGPTCDLPVRMRLDWRRDQLALDVALKDVQVNQFDHARADELFIEPEIPGYARLNLAERGVRSRPDGRTRTRQSMPPPDSRDDVEMGRPTPLPSVEEPVVPSLGRSEPEPEPEVAYGPAPPSLELVGAPVSHPPDPGPIRSAGLPGVPGRDATIER